MQRSDPRPGSTLSGFDVISAIDLEEHGSRSVFCRHRGTGCEVLHLVNDDPENLFAFAFRTPPRDDTGVSHILEHSVLCGSRSFPLKDPFLVLLKTSLQTFLNAFTFPDKTVYPASSMVEKDYFNLLRVYGDAVFFPLLKEEVFMQEGHHLELTDDPVELRRVGVVYNEMKGVFSSTESVVGDFSMRSLFPDTPYGRESGGDPASIPSLTHRDLVEFHRRYYHPSNCRIFLYGNVPTEKTLAFLAEHFLDSFHRVEIPSELPLQPRWEAPRRFERTVAAGEGGGSLERRSTVTLNWLTVSVSDAGALLALEVLAEILVGNAGAPLYRRLLESGLGEDVSPATGLDTELNEAVFTVGLRGTDPASVPAVEELVVTTLRELAHGGIPPELVEAAVHRVEFRNREIRRGGRPHSLTLMRRSLRGWLHGSPPETTLEFRPWMESLKQRLRGGGYLEQFLARHLLENPHRSTVLVRPDPEQGEREAREERARLGSLLAGMPESGRAEIARDQERLREFQEREDRLEDRARVPALRLEDLKKELELIPTRRVFEELPVRVLHHDLFTNGIVYLDLALDTRGLAPGLSDLLPLLGKAVEGSGLPGVPYHEVAGRLSALTGGFGSVLSVDSAAIPARGVCQYLIFRIKALEEKLPEALELTGALLREADFQDVDRLGKIVLEMRNDMKGSLVPGGNFYASLRAGSLLSPAVAVEERWRGITQYLMLSGLSDGLPAKLPGLAESLELLRSSVLRRSRLTVNLTCPESSLEGIRPQLERLLAGIPEAQPSVASPPGQRGGTVFSGPPGPAAERRAEALVASTNVSYVALSVPGATFGSPENAHEVVLAHFLTTGYLWEQVRMKGGAYGAGAGASGLEGVFSFSSYRDPGIAGTLEAYRNSLRFAGESQLTEEEFESILLGAVGKEDRPLAPGEKGFVALKRELLGISDQDRQERRNAMVAARLKDMRTAALRLLEGLDQGYTVVLTGSRALERADGGLEELARNRLQLPE